MLGGKGLIMGHGMALAKLLRCGLKQQSREFKMSLLR